MRTMMRTSLRSLLVTIALTAGTACGGSPSAPTPPPTPTPTPAPTPPQPATIDLTITGDPESAAGATWTCRGSVDGTGVDLEGILLKPAGPGPFPAVVISHGGGGNARTFSLGMGQEMRGWGLVAIGTNYTHAGGVAQRGLPDGEQGASTANVVRAHTALLILGKLGYVDPSRVAAHGHSLGAYVTTAFVAAHGGELRVASHTAGGARPAATPGTAPTDAQAAQIRTPYQWHHGDADTVLPLALDQRLDAALTTAGAPHEGHVYAGLGHDIDRHPDVLSRVRAWYQRHGLL
jgi:dienelactone hydrolase